MDNKRELGIRLILVALFSMSTLFSGLWMAGFLEHETDHFIRQAWQKDVETNNIVVRQDKNNSSYTKDQDTEIKRTAQSIEEDEDTEKDTDNNAVKQSYLRPDDLAMEFVSSPNPELNRVNDHASEKERTTKISSRTPTLDIEYDLQALESEINWVKFPTKKVVATGYTAGYESTGKHPDHPQYGITYSGVKVRRDLYSTIAADRSVFPLGTVLYIPNYGYGVVADTGSAIKGNKIDLYFNTVEDVYQLWGKQHIEVYVIKQGDGSVSESVLDRLNHNQALQVYKPAD